MGGSEPKLRWLTWEKKSDEVEFLNLHMGNDC